MKWRDGMLTLSTYAKQRRFQKRKLNSYASRTNTLNCCHGSPERGQRAQRESLLRTTAPMTSLGIDRELRNFNRQNSECEVYDEDLEIGT